MDQKVAVFIQQPQARAEIDAIPDEKERADVQAELQTFLTDRIVPGGRVSKVTKGRPGPPPTPSIWEFRIDLRAWWVRLLYFNHGAARYVVSCICKKRNKLTPHEVQVAEDRAKDLLGRLQK